MLLKIRPFQEKDFRYLVFNSRTKHVLRADAIGDACVLLPEDHGIVFPGGFYLQTGDHKVFPRITGFRGRSLRPLLPRPALRCKQGPRFPTNVLDSMRARSARKY